MKVKIWLVLSLVIGWLLIVSGKPTQAQTPTSQQSTPLIVKSSIDGNSSGDLWAWYGSGTQLQKLTTWDYNDQPFMSPDGKWVAYTGLSKSFVDYKGSDFGAVPMDMWLLNLSSGEAEIIGGQPADVTLDKNGRLTGYTIRSDPTWSPDGKMLAWDELVTDFLATPESNDKSHYEHLIVYDMQKKEVTAVTRITVESKGRDVAQPIWGDIGIAVPIPSFSRPEAQIFSRYGKLLYRFPIGGIGLPLLQTWIKDISHDYLSTVQTVADSATGTTQQNFELVDPRTGKHIDTPKALELYSTTAPNGITFLWTWDWDSVNVEPIWQVAIPGGPVSNISADKYRTPAISPDGRQAAYTIDGKLYIYSDGKSIQIGSNLPISGLTWGPLTWSIPRQP